jgi:uncharacterized membrane protein
MVKNMNQSHCVYINSAEEELISKAIYQAELQTTGEIHVHIYEGKVDGDILSLTKKKFLDLGLHHTPQRNCVLILLSLISHKVAIYGDEEIHKIVGQSGWDKLLGQIIDSFKKGDYATGIINCVQEVGNILKIHYPQIDDSNEENHISNALTRSQ